MCVLFNGALLLINRFVNLANEDASPIATKKQKALKGAHGATDKKSKKKATEKVNEEEKAEEVVVPEKTAAPKEKLAKKVKQTAAKAKKEEPVPEPEEDDEAETSPPENNEDGEEEEEVDVTTQALVETLDDGEADEEPGKQVGTFKKGQDVGKVPKLKKAVNSANGATASGNRGVLYLGSVPHGFYEHEIRQYFSQFGEITRLRVVRNKKTGASRHRAFIEFADAEVADIAARTMDSYLLFGHILRAKLVDPSQVHPELFKGSNRRFKVVPWNQMVGRHLEKPLGESKWQGKITKEEQRRAARAEKLKALGYEFDAPALKEAKAKEVAEIEGATDEGVKALDASPVAEAVEEKQEEVVERVKSPVSISQKAKKVKKGTKAKKVKA